MSDVNGADDSMVSDNFSDILGAAGPQEPDFDLSDVTLPEAEDAPDEPWDTEKFLEELERNKAQDTGDDADSDEDDSEDSANPTEPEGDTDPDAVDALRSELDGLSADELKAKLKSYEAWIERMARDPKSFIKGYLDALPDQDRAEVLQVTQPVAEKSDYDFEVTWEPSTYIEEWLGKQRGVIEELPRFSNEVAEALTQQHEIVAAHNQHLHEARLENAIIRAQLQALTELLDVKLPQVDEKTRAAINKKLQADSKLDYDTAVGDYGKAAQKAVKSHKQAAKPRPVTPADNADGFEDIPLNADAMTLLRGAKAGRW